MEQWLFTIPSEPRSWLSIVGWWELRRISYNFIIAVVGTVGITIFGLFDYLYFRAHPSEIDHWVPFLSIFGGALIANFLYTGGWIAELLARCLWRERARYFGPIMLSLGLLFSCVVCLLPATLSAIGWLVRFLWHS